ncbi:hypothetical protein [Paeniglutamicibacter sp. NPDC091659]|uniref:hypothetical protein n=1 Tax=Paeniglutamicibacter sp. NPDC091659 TaxID=3364389 RepID=UPI003801193D
MNTNAFATETFLLVPHTVTDLADFRARPGHYLVSVDREPERAAALWFDRATRNPVGSDGLVHLLYHGQHLLPLDLWDDVTGIWLALLDVLDGFLDAGNGTGTLSGQPASLALKGTSRNAVFTANGMSRRVDPADVVPGILTGAERYFHWVHHAIGRGQGEALARIRSAQREHRPTCPSRGVT